MKKKKIFGATLKEQLRASTRDRLYHFIMARDTIRGVALHATRMVSEMRWNHDLGVLESLVLGHAYMAAALMSADLKGNDRIRLGVECSGPIKGLSVEANAFGEVRGYLERVPIPIAKPLESFDLSPFFGAGFISVTKYLQDAKHPFTGKVMMEYGTLARDLALYHLKSEQIPSAFSLGILFDKNGEVRSAGGLLLQALPGADDNVLAQLEDLVHHLPSMGQVVGSDAFPHDWMDHTFTNLAPRLLAHRGVEFMCHCGEQQIRGMLAMLARDELADMAQKGPFPVEIHCHKCNTLYAFDQAEMQTLWAEKDVSD
jgi:molecular chaperone Hsp33